MKRHRTTLCTFPVIVGLMGAAAFAQAPKVTGPKEALGFEVGADYQVANYTQLEAWWKKLATESNRMKLFDLGLTAEGRHQWMTVITSPENHRKMARYKEIARKLALAEGVGEEEARALAAEGKAVVWIDGGLHANETVGSQQLMELVYQMVSRTDPETLRFLNDVILLCVPANPDGQELVANWYMREADPKKRSMAALPRLYEKYAGHDNNRDFYMSNLPESTNMNRALYMEWFPQIMYNHHQTGPAGTVVFIPPFRDPFNYNFDPLVVVGIEQVGAAMHSRLIAEGKPGSAMRSAASYSTWFNGGLRTTTYFHNMIGILTEIIGSPTPGVVPLIADRQLPTGDVPAPIAPQVWHYRQSIEYEMTQNRAMLDYASRNRETLLYNIYRMGKNSIDRGSRDSWTVTPKRIEMLRAAGRGRPAVGRGAAPDGAPEGDAPAVVAGGRGAALSADLYKSVLQKPELRDPRGYIVPASQADFPTATRFVNTLLKNGITVHRARTPFQVAGKAYPAGSYVVKTAQAFRPHVLDMFEPQDHPNDFRYPGGPPIAPYDVTGYTLAFLMGVEFDRMLEGFDGPFEKVSGLLPMAPGTLSGPASPAGYLVSHRVLNGFTLTNRLLKEQCEVDWLKTAGSGYEAGAVRIPASARARGVVERGVKELGINVQAIASAPKSDALRLKAVRIGLFDQYGGSMPSGWMRFIFEQFEFPFEVVHTQTLDRGDLSSRFDLLVFMNGAIRRSGAAGGGRGGGGGAGAAPRPESIPEEYRSQLGRFTPEQTLPQVKKFVESGGAVITVGSSIALAELLGLPVKDALVEKAADGRERPLPREKFYIPGSVMRATVDNSHPLAWGMDKSIDVFFDSSPVFRIEGNDGKVVPVAWFASPDTLRSGWAWGQQYLNGGTAIAEAKVGEGKVFLMGPEVTFRAQPHATFKFLFNGIYYGTAKAAVVD